MTLTRRVLRSSPSCPKPRAKGGGGGGGACFNVNQVKHASAIRTQMQTAYHTGTREYTYTNNRTPKRVKCFSGEICTAGTPWHSSTQQLYRTSESVCSSYPYQVQSCTTGYSCSSGVCSQTVSIGYSGSIGNISTAVLVHTAAEVPGTGYRSNGKHAY